MAKKASGKEVPDSEKKCTKTEKKCSKKKKNVIVEEKSAQKAEENVTESEKNVGKTDPECENSEDLEEIPEESEPETAGGMRVTVSLNDQAKEILQKATEKGVEHSFMFVSTFDRYMKHLKHLAELQKVIDDEGMLVKKTYVKGRANLYINPAVSAYNQTAGAADKTAQLLLRYIVQPLRDPDAESGDDFDLF